MGKYRNKLEIIADILSVLKGGARKTRIMYQANLSYSLLTRYLNFTLKSGLISVSSESEEHYVVTAKGIEFLQRYRRYSQRNKDIEEKLKDVMKERTLLERIYAREMREQVKKQPEQKEPQTC